MAVFYDAVRHFGVPETLVSDNGNVFTSYETRWICELLGTEKKEGKKGRPYQNYLEAACGIARKGGSWDNLIAAHEKRMRDCQF